jgi:hypothetical protein
MRNGECAEAYQRHAISFAEGARDAVDGGINGGSCLRFADLASACNPIDQIGFVHSCSSQVSFIPSRNRAEKRLSD